MGRIGPRRRFEAEFEPERPFRGGSATMGDEAVLLGVGCSYFFSLILFSGSVLYAMPPKSGGYNPTCHANVAPSLHTPTMQHGTCTMANARMVAPWLAFHLPFPPIQGRAFAMANGAERGA